MISSLEAMPEVRLSTHNPSFLPLFHQFVFLCPFIPSAVSSVCLLMPLHSFCCFISLSSHIPSFLLLFLNISSILMHHCDNQSEMYYSLFNLAMMCRHVVLYILVLSVFFTVSWYCLCVSLCLGTVCVLVLCVSWYCLYVSLCVLALSVYVTVCLGTLCMCHCVSLYCLCVSLCVLALSVCVTVCLGTVRM